MEIKEFVADTVKKMDTKTLNVLKKKLIGDYISFSFINEKKVSADVFCEKLCDYFEKLELKTGEKFEKFLNNYMSDLDELVKKNIPKEPKATKSNPRPQVPRSRKYYLFASDFRKSKEPTLRQFQDYSRIMMCLYMSIINSEGQEIDDFEYSTNSLDIDMILSSMKTEKPNIINPIGKKQMFDLSELYSMDTCTFIISFISLPS